MARMRTADGKRELLAVRVSEYTASRIDAARGDTSRADWVRRAIEMALGLEQDPGGGLEEIESRLARVESALERAGAFSDGF